MAAARGDRTSRSPDAAGPRVAYVGPVPPIAGGIAQCGACIVDALRTLGADVSVLSWASQYPSFLYKGPLRDAAAVAPLGARFSLRWWDPTSWLRAGRAASRADLLVLPWVTPVLALPQLTIMRVARLPVSIVVHNALPHERMPFDARLARWVFSRADFVVTHAQSVLDAVHALAPGVEGQVARLPPTLPVVAGALPESPPLRLLCLGYVRHYKGFDLALDAVRVLAERGRDVELTIAGDVWEDREGWRARVAAPDLGGRVQLVDRYLGDEEVVRALREHHIVLLPYRSGTQSAIVPLAFAAGRPVVATTVGGLPEVVLDGENGRLVPPNDATALADAVADVASDLDRYAAAAAASSWSWIDVASALLTPLHLA